MAGRDVHAMKLILETCLLLAILTHHVQGACQIRDEGAAIAADSTRNCRKECTTTADCSGDSKQCLCDDLCGLSCYNPDAECPDPTGTLAHGTVTLRSGSLTYDSVAKYTCNDGYFLTGQKTRTCRSTKEWSHTEPNCTRGCDPPLNLGNGFPNEVLLTGYVPGGTVTYACKTGYYGWGDFVVTCQNDYTWSSAQFTCAKQDCGSPGDLENGKRDSNDFDFGSRIKFVCDPGYNMIGNSERRCNAGEANSPSGVWTGSVPTCEALTCAAPDELENGDIDERFAAEREYNQEIDYSCDVGYNLVGPDRGRCNENATWGEMPTCVVDPNADFEIASGGGLGGYTVVGTFKRTYEEYGVDSLPTYVLSGQGSLQSAVVPVANTSDGVCVKFDYKTAVANNLIGESKVGDGDFQTVWTADPSSGWAKGEIPVRRPSGVTGELQVQWRLRAAKNAVIDNIVAQPISECAAAPTQPLTTVLATTRATQPLSATTAAVTQTPTTVTTRATRPLSATTVAATQTRSVATTVPQTIPTDAEMFVTTVEPDSRGGKEPKTAATEAPKTSVSTRAQPPSAPNTTVIIVVIFVVVFLVVVFGILGLYVYKNHQENKKMESTTVERENGESAGKLVGATDV